MGIFSNELKTLRESAGIPQRKVAAALDIDTATYSKIENGLYVPRKEQVIALASYFQRKEEDLLKFWTADKIATVTNGDMELAEEAIRLVQDQR